MSAIDAGELFGMAPQTIRQMRLDPDHPNYRTPPEGWEAKLAPHARKRGGALTKLADALERES